MGPWVFFCQRLSMFLLLRPILTQSSMGVWPRFWKAASCLDGARRGEIQFWMGKKKSQRQEGFGGILAKPPASVARLQEGVKERLHRAGSADLGFSKQWLMQNPPRLLGGCRKSLSWLPSSSSWASSTLIPSFLGVTSIPQKGAGLRGGGEAAGAISAPRTAAFSRHPVLR